MMNPGVDINNVGKVADFFGLVELGQAINDKQKDEKKWEVELVAGTWVTNRPVPSAMQEDYGCCSASRYTDVPMPYVISRIT